MFLIVLPFSEHFINVKVQWGFSGRNRENDKKGFGNADLFVVKTPTSQGKRQASNASMMIW